MKKFLILAAMFVASLASAATVTVTDGISLAFPVSLNLPPYVSYTFSQTNTWPAGPVTNGNEIILTNTVIPIERNEGIGITFTLGAQGTTTPSPSNVVAYFDVSYNGGRTFTSTRPLSATFSTLGTNTPYRPTFYIPYTNNAGAQIFRFTALSNPVPAGAANHVKYWLTNVVLTTRKGDPR